MVAALYSLSLSGGGGGGALISLSAVVVAALYSLSLSGGRHSTLSLSAAGGGGTLLSLSQRGGGPLLSLSLSLSLPAAAVAALDSCFAELIQRALSRGSDILLSQFVLHLRE